MNIARLFIASLFVMSSSFAHLHEPEISVSLDPKDHENSHVSLIHQSTVIFDHEDILIFCGNIKPRLDKSIYSEIGFGYRKFFDSLGFGLNFFASTSNKPGFYTYQLSPGVELFCDHFQLSFNQYIPLEDTKSVKKMDYTFDTLSEMNLTYKPSKKYEFSVGPYFNHSNKKIGVAGAASAFIFDQWQVKVSPFYESKNKGVSLSLGFSFGGAKEKKNQSIRKQESFVYHGEKVSSDKRMVPPIGYIPVSEGPVVLIPVELQMPTDKTPEKDTPKPDTGWWDFFFGRSSSRAGT